MENKNKQNDSRRIVNDRAVKVTPAKFSPPPVPKTKSKGKSK